MNIKRLVEEGFPIGEKPGKVPFSHTTTVTIADPRTKKRFEECFSFFDDFEAPVLDIGGVNVMGEAIKERFSELGRAHITIDNTLECDFNEELIAPGGNYRTILCFEVIEHVMNPLLFMRNIHRLLGQGGVVYLSTPKAPLMSILSSNYHLTEYKQTRLEQLFRWAGFEIEKTKMYNVHPWLSAFEGIRPLWKLVFQRYVIFKLSKGVSC